MHKDIEFALECRAEGGAMVVLLFTLSNTYIDELVNATA